MPKQSLFRTRLKPKKPEATATSLPADKSSNTSVFRIDSSQELSIGKRFCSHKNRIPNGILFLCQPLKPIISSEDPNGY